MPAPLERTSVPGIFKRGDAYVVVYRFNGRQHKRTCRSFADARSVKAQLKADIDRGEYQRGRETFEDFARTWIDSPTGRTTRGFRDSTGRGYRRAIEKRAIPYFSKRSKVMTDIGPPEIRGFIAWLFDERGQGRALTLGTVWADVAAVRALFATAVEDGVLRHNPALGVRISHPRADGRDGRQGAASRAGPGRPHAIPRRVPGRLAAVLRGAEPHRHADRGSHRVALEGH